MTEDFGGVANSRMVAQLAQFRSKANNLGCLEFHLKTFIVLKCSEKACIDDFN